MVDINDLYRILGLDYTDDIRLVKKTYAELVKQYHPEEHPEEWQIIHSAYEIICKYIRATSKDPAFAYKNVNHEGTSGELQQADFKNESDNSNARIDFVETGESEEEKMIDSVVDIVEKTYNPQHVFNNPEANNEDLSDIVDLLSTLQSREVLIDGKPVIKCDDYKRIRRHKKFEIAMMNPLFVKKLANIFASSAPDSNACAYVAYDAKKIIRKSEGTEVPYDYIRLIESSKHSVSDSRYTLEVIEARKNRYKEKTEPDTSFKIVLGFGLSSILFLIIFAFIVKVFPDSKIGRKAEYYRSLRNTTYIQPTISFSDTTSSSLETKTIEEEPNREMVLFLEKYGEFLDECTYFFETYDPNSITDDPDVSENDAVLKIADLTHRKTVLKLEKDSILFKEKANSDSHEYKTFKEDCSQIEKQLDEIWKY